MEKDGKIPIYSANVFEPFGYFNKKLITDFSIPSVLWGIDGDWAVNYMPAEKPFYPTDHCGVLRVKTKEILPRLLAGILDKEGKKQRFSRSLRASIDRIKGITISVPPLAQQQKIVLQIEEYEAKVAECQKIMETAQEKKKAILQKYL